jgi:hypothetical protein
MYEIPSKEIKITGALTLTENWDPYIIHISYNTNDEE